MAFRGTYDLCTNGCGLVVEVPDMKDHLTRCNGSLRLASKKALKKRGQTSNYSEASRAFLAKQALNVEKPFTVKCRHCHPSCSLDISKLKDPNLSVNEILSAFEEHFQAMDASSAAKEVRAMKRTVAALEQKTEYLQERLKEEADQKLEVAKVVEQNSHLLISEQLVVNEALVKEAARLKRELVEAETRCVICRDSKPSRAFIPCGHVCLCSSCWAGFERNGDGRCPNCRRHVQFSFSVFI